MGGEPHRREQTRRAILVWIASKVTNCRAAAKALGGSKTHQAHTSGNLNAARLTWRINASIADSPASLAPRYQTRSFGAGFD